MIQDVVSLFARGNFYELAQKKWCSLGNGRELCNVLRLTLEAIDLYGEKKKKVLINNEWE